eukprot:364952-Chlamydomonas_euryale.AAC.4
MVAGRGWWMAVKERRPSQVCRSSQLLGQVGSAGVNVTGVNVTGAGRESHRPWPMFPPSRQIQTLKPSA